MKNKNKNKLKFVKTFESFSKVNEEVPFNYDAAAERVKIKWTPDEKKDLEEFGATNIKDSTALIDDDDLMVFITKDKKGYKIDANKELFSYRYGLKPNLSGHERTPDKGDIDYGKKIRQPLRIPPFIENWNDALKFLNLIFRKHKFGWES